MSEIKTMLCRLCSSIGRTRLSLTPTPVANSYTMLSDTDAVRYPLDVMECLNCGHIQLRHRVPVPFDRQYAYATPAAMRPHLAEAADTLRRHYPTATQVLEIGCNNGLYMEELQRVGFSVTGVDPSACPSKHVLSMPFTHATIARMSPVDLIVANNVLAHVDDLRDVFQGIDQLLTNEGALIFEVQYFPWLVKRTAFDMIYHEHRDYHTLAPLVPFLKRHGFVITRVDFLAVHGGSVRVYCERHGQGWSIPDEPLDWCEFTARIAQAKLDVIEQLDLAGDQVIAFGAPAKACTLIHHCGIADRIAFCVDDTPAKQHKFIPGTDIRILPTSRLKHNHVPMLLLAWNYEQEIRAQYPDQQFIVPFAHSRQEVTL